VVKANRRLTQRAIRNVQLGIRDEAAGRQRGGEEKKRRGCRQYIGLRWQILSARERRMNRFFIHLRNEQTKTRHRHRKRNITKILTRH
jgi:hypothetical protein